MDFSWLDFALGAVTAYLGVRAGAAMERRRKPGKDEPICGCGHNYSMHDDHGCNVRTGWHWGKGGERIDEMCECKFYTGPEPLPRYIP